MDPTAEDYKTAWFDNVNVDNNGNPLGLFSIPWNKIKGKDLRPLAKLFGVRNYGQMKKEILIERLIATFVNKDLYDAETQSNNQSSRRQKQCTFQLINILFSDEFADNFGCAGDTPSRAQLDSGDARNSRGFWIRVQAAFIEPHPVYDKLQFTDDVHLANSAINPADNIQPHDWKKLRAMWMDVNSNYKQSLHDFTLSQVHMKMISLVSFMGSCLYITSESFFR